MVYRHPRSKMLSLLAVITMVAAMFLVGGLQADNYAAAAGVPPAFAQGFSEIVKAVTPAVVNIAVTGGGEARREGRRPVPPGPFGGPPPGPGDEPRHVEQAESCAAAGARKRRPGLGSGARDRFAS